MCVSHMACSLSSCLQGPSSAVCGPSWVPIPAEDAHTPARAQPNMVPLLPISCLSATGSSFTLQLSWADPSIWASCGLSLEAVLRVSTIPEGWGLPKDSSVFCATENTACFKTWAVI